MRPTTSTDAWPPRSSMRHPPPPASTRSPSAAIKEVHCLHRRWPNLCGLQAFPSGGARLAPRAGILRLWWYGWPLRVLARPWSSSPIHDRRVWFTAELGSWIKGFQSTSIHIDGAGSSHEHPHIATSIHQPSVQLVILEAIFRTQLHAFRLNHVKMAGQW